MGQTSKYDDAAVPPTVPVNPATEPSETEPATEPVPPGQIVPNPPPPTAPEPPGQTPAEG